MILLKIPLKKQLTGDNNALSNDTSARDLASIYSQTISYGFFAARLYGGSAVEEFSRTNAAEFIPVSYPFLKRLFQYLTRHDLDDRIVWIINDLADLFSTADITAVSGNFKNTALPDEPYKHFHETFLEYYDPEFRKSHSGSDKPEPVVAFIKEAIDHCISSNRLE